MIGAILNPLDYLFGSLILRGTAHQAAMGATIGFIIGLQPALNGSFTVLFWAALLILLLFNIGLRIGIIMALLGRLLGTLVVDVYVSYPLGYQVVEGMGDKGNSAIGSFVKATAESPSTGWMNVDNYAGAGAMILGLLVALPMYVLVRWVTNRVRKWVGNLARTTTVKTFYKRTSLRWGLWFFAPSVFDAFGSAIERAEQDEKDKKRVEKIDAKFKKRKQKRGKLAQVTDDERSLADTLAIAAADQAGDEDANTGLADLAQSVHGDDATIAAAADTADDGTGSRDALAGVTDADLQADSTDELVASGSVPPPPPPPKPGQGEGLPTLDRKSARRNFGTPSQPDPSGDESDDIFANASNDEALGSALFDALGAEEDSSLEGQTFPSEIELEDSDIDLDVADDDTPAQPATPAKKGKRPADKAAKRQMKEERWHSKQEKKHKRARKPKKQKTLRAYFLLTLAIFLGLPTAAAAYAYVDRNNLAEWAIEGPLASSLGLEIEVDGVDVDIAEGVLTVDGLAVKQIRALSEADLAAARSLLPEGVEPGRMFAAKRLTAALDTGEAFSGRVHVTLRAESPEVLVLRESGGRMSYAGPGTQPNAGSTVGGVQTGTVSPVLDTNGEPVLATIPINGTETEVIVVRDPRTGQRLFRQPGSNQIVNKDGEIVFIRERQADGSMRWTDEDGADYGDGEYPEVQTEEPTEYQPEEANLLEEVRAFVEEMIERYDLDDPDAWAEYARMADELYAEYGPAVTQALESMSENDRIDYEKESEEAKKRMLAERIQRMLLGRATYVVPRFAPAPEKPTFWLQELAILDARVHYVDLSADTPSAVSETGYSVALRNLATQRVLLPHPTVVLIAKGVAQEGQTELQTVQALLNQAAALRQPSDDSLTMALVRAITSDQAEEASSALVGGMSPSEAAAIALTTRFQLHLESGVSLNDILDLFLDEGTTLPFRGGDLQIYSAKRDWLEQQVWYDESNWYFDPATGETDAEKFTPDPPREQDRRRNAIGIGGDRLGGVLVVQLKGAVLADAAFGLPAEAIAFINEMLGGEAEGDWRFVIGLQGTVGNPNIKLLNEAEVIGKLRVLAVNAVKKLADEGLGRFLELFDPIANWDEFEAVYQGRPEAFLVWEEGVGASATVAEQIAAMPEGEQAELVAAFVDRLRNVVSPLLFVDDKMIALRALANNGAQVATVVVRDKFQELAAIVLDAVLEVLPLRRAEGQSAAQRRAELRDALLEQVAETMVPTILVQENGDVVLANGNESFDFERQMNRALGRFATNSEPVLSELIEDTLSAGVRSVVGWVNEFHPDGNIDEAEVSDRLLAGVAAPLVPTFAMQADQTVQLAGAPYEQRVSEAVNVFKRNVAGYVGEVVTEVLQSFIDSSVGTVAGALRPALEAVPAWAFPPSFDRGSIPERLADGLSGAITPDVTVDPDTFEVSVDIGDRADIERQLISRINENAGEIAVELADGYIGVAASFVTDEIIGTDGFPAGYTDAQMQADLRAGVGERMFPRSTDGDGFVTFSTDLNAGVGQIASNLNVVAVNLAPALIDRTLAPYETALSDALQPIEGLLPEGVTVATYLQRLRAGVPEEYIGDDAIRLTSTNANERPSFAFEPNEEAAQELIADNLRDVAADAGSAVASNAVDQTADAVLTRMSEAGIEPSSNYTAEAIRDDLRAGLDNPTRYVSGSGTNVSVDFSWVGDQVDQNGIVVAERIADTAFTDESDRLAGAIVEAVDANQMPQGTTRASLATRIGEGVAAAFIQGERFSEIQLSPEAARQRLQQNALVVLRSIGDSLLAAQATQVVRPMVDGLNPALRQLGSAADVTITFTDADVQQLTAQSVQGASAVAIDANTVAGLEAEPAELRLNLDAARETIRSNANWVVGNALTTRARRFAGGMIRRQVNPLLNSSQQRSRGDAYYDRVGAEAVVESWGRDRLAANPNNPAGAFTQGAIESERYQTVRRREVAVAMLLNARNTLTGSPLSLSLGAVDLDDMPSADRQRLLAQNDVRQQWEIVRAFMASYRPAIQAVRSKLPFLNDSQASARIRDVLSLPNGLR